MSTKLKPMRSVWHSLLWKEWHEHKWHVLGLSVLMVLFPFLFYWQGDLNQQVATFGGTLLCYGLLAGLFTGMVTAARENQRRTMPFLQALPVRLTHPAATKLLLSILTICFPIVAFAGIEYAHLQTSQLSAGELDILLDWSSRSGPFVFNESQSLAIFLAKLTLMSCLFTASLLIWMAAVGVNRSDEIRAGVMGFLVIVCVWLAFGLALDRADRSGLPTVESAMAVVGAAIPGGSGMIGSLHRVGGFGNYWVYVLVAVGAHSLLIARYLRTFGQKTMRPARTSGDGHMSENSGWLLPPRRSQLSAIVWKQLSETGPLVVLAAPAVLAIAGVVYLLNRDNGFSTKYSEVLAGTALGVGYLVTVVAGMGVFLEDVKPNVGIFWRSRPVNATTWFFVKFFTGLAVLLVCFGLLFALAYFLPGGDGLLDSQQPGLQIGVFALVFLLTYTLSMASYCMGKHPIVAVMATIGMMYGGAFASSVVVNRVIGHWEMELAIGLILLAQVVAMVIAWGAVRNNWGWHK